MTLQEMRDELVRRGLLREEEERYYRGGHSRFLVHRLFHSHSGFPHSIPQPIHQPPHRKHTGTTGPPRP